MPSHTKIRSGRLALGLTEQQFADRLGVSRGAVQQWEKENGTAPARKKQPEVAALLGITVSQLMTDDQPNAFGGLPVVAIGDEDHLGNEYIQIRETEVRFAAGNGRVASFDELADSVPATYRREWFIKEGFKPENAKRFKVHGDSMEPFLYDSDTVLVNLAETSVVNGKVYALRYGDELRIKRVYKKIDGGLILHSDNPDFLPRDEEISPDHVQEYITIIGRVRDKSGTGGL